MSLGGSVSDYLGTTGAVDWIEGAGGEQFVKVYNDTGAAITNGGVYILDWTDDADGKGVYPTSGTAATNSAAVTEVVVINNFPLGKTTIADAKWGYAQYRGYCPAITAGSGGQTDEQYLEVLNGTIYSTNDGATKTTKSFGIAKSTAVGATSFAGFLFGYRVVVAGS